MTYFSMYYILINKTHYVFGTLIEFLIFVQILKQTTFVESKLNLSYGCDICTNTLLAVYYCIEIYALKCLIDIAIYTDSTRIVPRAFTNQYRGFFT